MALLPPAPDSLSDCLLYQALERKDTSSHGLTDRVRAFTDAATPLLESIIAGPFTHYTLHNPQHARKLVHIAGQIVSRHTLERCTALDCALLIQACYLHDLGLSLSAQERESTLTSDEFLTTMRGWPELESDLSSARAALQRAQSEPERLSAESVIFQLHEAALAAHLRPRHATPERYHALLRQLKQAANRQDLCYLRGVSFEETLVLVCESHNLDVGCLAEARDAYEDRFSRQLAIGGEYVNVQFAAAILRLADILDFDRERTPRVLFENLGIASRSVPGAQLSLSEWQKHMSVHSIDIAPTEVVVSADSSHPAIERTIREFCGVIEREIRDTLAVLRRNTADVTDTYACTLPVSVRPSIRANGYVFKDLSFKLDETAVMNLLMGERLYANQYVPVRELVQNAVDACRVRAVMARGGYNPVVRIAARTDSDGETWIDVSDNGVGMDEYVLSEFFFRIGKQYYSSSHFKTLVGADAMESFVPIARFGVGVVSVFMIGDVIQVDTQAFASTRGDLGRRKFTVSSRGGLAFMTEVPAGEPGTTVSVRLKRELTGRKNEFLKALSLYLGRTVVRPAVPVHIELGAMRTTLDHQTVVGLRRGAEAVLSELGLHAAVIDLEKYSSRGRGRVVLFFFINEKGQLTHLKPPHSPKDRDIRDRVSVQVLSGHTSNRLTVNGFTMAAKKLGRLFRFLSRNTPVVVDCEIVGDDGLKYDVAREKISGQSAIDVRREVRDAVIRALQDTDIWTRLAPETLEILEEMRAGREELAKARVVDSAVVEKVRAALPKAPWPRGVHRDIAQTLGMSNGLVSRAITQILAENKRRDISTEAGKGLVQAEPPAAGSAHD